MKIAALMLRERDWRSEAACVRLGFEISEMRFEISDLRFRDCDLGFEICGLRFVIERLGISGFEIWNRGMRPDRV